MVPLLVRRIGFEKLQIISGHRRKSALEAIGEKYAECDLVDMTDDEAYKALMVTNIQSQSLTEIEEAEGIKHMLDAFEWSQSRVAKEFGKSQQWVSSRLSYFKLSPDAKELVTTRVVSQTHIREVASLRQEQQAEAIAHVIDKNLSTRETAEFVKEINHYQEVKEEAITDREIPDSSIPFVLSTDEAETKHEIHIPLIKEEGKKPEIHVPRNLTGTYQERKEAADVLLKIRLAIVDMSNPYYPDKLVELNLDNEALELMDKLENSMKWLKQKIANARGRVDGTITNGTVLEFKTKSS